MTTTPGTSAEYTRKKFIMFTTIYILIQILCIASRYVARYMVGLDDAMIVTSLAMQSCMAGVKTGQHLLRIC